MKTIIRILIERDGLTIKEAQEQVQEFVENYLRGNNADPFTASEVFESEFGLEPDYFEELLFSVL